MPFLTVMVGAEAAGPALRHEKGRLYGKVGQCTTMEMPRRVEKFLCCTQWSCVSYVGSSAEYGGRRRWAIALQLGQMGRKSLIGSIS